MHFHNSRSSLFRTAMDFTWSQRRPVSVAAASRGSTAVVVSSPEQPTLGHTSQHPEHLTGEEGKKADTNAGPEIDNGGPAWIVQDAVAPSESGDVFQPSGSLEPESVRARVP